MKKKIEVVKDEADEIPFEVMERAIVEISESMKRITETRVSRKMLVVLLRDSTGLTKGTIESVLNGLDRIEQNYLKPKAKP